MAEEKVREVEEFLYSVLQRAKEKVLNQQGREDNNREEKQGEKQKKEAVGKKPASVYLPVHAVDCNRVSKCEFYKLEQFEVDSHTVCVALCTATDRYITRSNTAKCIKYWETCPFRQMFLNP